MKALLLTCLILLPVLNLHAAASQGWMTDLDKAKVQAKAEKKMILINFTGSDWCPWCVRLKKEVFSTPEFMQYARLKLVLMEADFPRSKPQPEPLKKANQALQEKYQIEGFPTVVVLNSAGQEIGRLGYMKGGAKTFLSKLDELAKK